jgi:hypothetical protein
LRARYVLRSEATPLVQHGGGVELVSCSSRPNRFQCFRTRSLKLASNRANRHTLKAAPAAAIVVSESDELRRAPATPANTRDLSSFVRRRSRPFRRASFTSASNISAAPSAGRWRRVVAVDHLWTWSRPSPWRSGGISCLRSRLAAFRVWYHNGEESWDELCRRLDAEWCPQNVAG